MRRLTPLSFLVCHSLLLFLWILFQSLFILRTMTCFLSFYWWKLYFWLRMMVTWLWPGGIRWHGCIWLPLFIEHCIMLFSRERWKVYCKKRTFIQYMSTIWNMIDNNNTNHQLEKYKSNRNSYFVSWIFNQVLEKLFK